MADRPVLTGIVGGNAELFPEVLRLYVPRGSRIADVTFGRGVFWRNVDTAQYSLLRTDLVTGTDARKLPYENASLDAVVFDPPYMHSGNSVKESLDRCYKNNGKAQTWRDLIPLYREVAAEAHRVLKPSGILICKTQDTVVNHRQLFVHVELLSLPGYICEDLFVLIQKSRPLMSGKWTKQFHARKNHSYFVISRRNP